MFTSHLSLSDQILLAKHLAMMLGSGIALTEGLALNKDHTTSRVARTTIDSLIQDVQNGQSLTIALTNTNRFSPLFVSLVEIGEESGTLDQRLQQLAIYLDQQRTLQQKILSSLLYPAIVISAVLILGGVISIFILPQLVDFFQAFDTALPLSTQILLNISVFAKQFGLITIFSLLVGGFFLSLLLQTPLLKPIWHRVQLSLPLFGSIIKAYNLARVMQTYEILLKSSMPIVEATEKAQQAISNLEMKMILQRFRLQLEQGNPLAASLHQADTHSIIPTLAVRLFAVGNETGKLEETCAYLHDYYEQDIEIRTKNLTTLLEPVLLIIIGLVVGFVALAIISPIYELTGSIR
jgi:type II secretory pathway component PulF